MSSTSSRRSSSTPALLVVALATVWQAGGAVLLAHVSGPASSLRIAFLAFSVAGLLSWLPQAWRRGRGRAPIDRGGEGSVRTRVSLVVVTAGAFLAFYAALAWVPVEAASAVEVAAGLVTVLVITSRGERVTRAGLWRASAASGAVLVCAIATVTVLGRDVHSGAAAGGVAVGIGLALMAGACGGGVVLVSSASGARGLSAGQLARERFSGAAFIAAVVVLVTASGAGVPAAVWGEEALVAVVSISLPVLLLQWGLVRAEPVGSELVLASLPALVHLGESARSHRWDPLLGSLMGLLVLTVLAAQAAPFALHARRGGGIA